MSEALETRALWYGEATQKLEELTGTPAWDLFQDRLRDEFQKHQSLLNSGKLTHEQYQRECGFIGGLDYAFGLVERVARERDNAIALAEGQLELVG